MAVFDISAFRLSFPAFASETAYPDALITTQSEIGLAYIDEDFDYCGKFDLLWQLVTAHLLYLNAQIASGNTTTGQLASATVGSVSVSVTAPKNADEFAYWLGLSPYGLQMLALLRKCAVGGWIVGGRPERAAFRSVGGTFPNGGRVW
jgi:hypothetical protein